MKGTILRALNYKLLGISVALLVLGYVLLGQGPIDNPLSWTVAPIVLVLVYSVLLPWSIMARGKQEVQEDNKGV
jgi:hypothetical protein